MALIALIVLNDIHVRVLWHCFISDLLFFLAPGMN